MTNMTQPVEITINSNEWAQLRNAAVAGGFDPQTPPQTDDGQLVPGFIEAVMAALRDNKDNMSPAMKRKAWELSQGANFRLR